MKAALQSLGLNVAGGQSNALFFDAGCNATHLAERLRAQGILFKPWKEEGYETCARVSVGLPEENDAFLSALERDVREQETPELIVEAREYTLKVGTTGLFLEKYEQQGLEIQKSILGHLVGYYSCEIGELNQIIHLWAYLDLEDRRARRKAAFSQSGLAGLSQRPRRMYLIGQKNRILEPHFAEHWAGPSPRPLARLRLELRDHPVSWYESAFWQRSPDCRATT